jgi:hypothetical protein
MSHCFMSLLRGSQYNRPLNASSTTPPVLHRRQCGKRSFFASEVKSLRMGLRRLESEIQTTGQPLPSFQNETSRIHSDHPQPTQSAPPSCLRHEHSLRRHTMNFQPLRLAHRIPPHDGVSPLPPDFCPGHWTVICGRGKQNFNHGMYRIGSR